MFLFLDKYLFGGKPEILIQSRYEFKSKVFAMPWYKKNIFPIVAAYRSIPYKIAYLQARNNTKVAFYPEIPHYVYAIYKICHVLGYKITDKLEEADLIINFEDKTFRKQDSTFMSLSKKYNAINFRCTDISKKKVEDVHIKVFGYGLFINPVSYKGKFVKKSDENAKHDGIILDKSELPENGFVYQQIINNADRNMVLDLRTPVFKGEIPFVYLKYRSILTRFSNTNSFAEMIDPDKVFSNEEQNKISEFCQEIGLEYGEIDILRDNDSKKIYIVDVNNTPAGPPNHISKKEYALSLKELSNAFKQAFILTSGISGIN